MDSKLFTLNWRDLANGLVIAVGGVILGMIESGTFDIFSADWTTIGKLALNAAVIYLAKKFFTTSNGTVAGIKGT